VPLQPIRLFGDPVLRKPALEVVDFDRELRRLVEDLTDTMLEAPGAGLAAPQIGVDLQLVIFGFSRNERYPDAPPVPETVLLNPQVEPIGSDEEEGWEGCLSVPGMRGVVPRFARIRYRGVDVEGRPVEREAEGFHARVVQHECDHLVGKLYPMRIRDFSRFGFTSVLFPDLADPADD
jgi:peptide deformylase